VAEEAAWRSLVASMVVRGGSSIVAGPRTRAATGNIADFVRNWGAAYTHMIVLDADSVMSGKTPDPARLMDAHPDVASSRRATAVAARRVCAHGAVRRPSQRADAVQRPGLLAAGRGQLLGPQRHHRLQAFAGYAICRGCRQGAPGRGILIMTS